MIKIREITSLNPTIAAFIFFYLGKSKLGKEYGVDKSKAERLFKSVVSSSDYELWIAFNDQDKPVGFMAGYIQDALFSLCKFSYDLGMFVHPDYENQGVGKKFIDVFLNWSREKGAKTAHICTCFGDKDTDENNTRKLVSMGFEQWGHLIRYKLEDD